MSKSVRLQSLVNLLQDGKIHRAKPLAQHFKVSVRTIYRDMAQLAASGVPIQGTPGEGYRASAETTLPPLNLTGTELEVFRLGLSVITDAGDAGQKTAAESLLSKLETALAEGPSALSPQTPTPLLQRHLTQIRQAIATKQKLRIRLGNTTLVIRPLRLDYFGRIWRCVCWDEALNDFATPPVTEITFLAVLPGLFVDEPGKTLHDYLTR